jgi:uncharacterized OsmC-like protein
MLHMNNTPAAGSGFTWSLRVRWNAGQTSTVYARNNAFTVGPPASFAEEDPYPSAIEYLLGALGADLTNGFLRNAASRDINVDGVEMALSGRLENPLVYVGVIGEKGEPYVSRIEGTLYASTDAGEELAHAVWQTTLERSPVANTLRRSATIQIELRLVD